MTTKRAPNLLLKDLLELLGGADERGRKAIAGQFFRAAQGDVRRFSAPEGYVAVPVAVPSCEVPQYRPASPKQIQAAIDAAKKAEGVDAGSKKGAKGKKPSPPKPSALKPVAPKPAAPKPVAPKPVAPKPAAPPMPVAAPLRPAASQPRPAAPRPVAVPQSAPRRPTATVAPAPSPVPEAPAATVASLPLAPPTAPLPRRPPAAAPDVSVPAPASVKNLRVIPTGSPALDAALGVGGLPRGVIVEIFGPESSGKTTLALHAIKEAQAAGGVAAFIDTEGTFDAKSARSIGVNTEKLLVSQPDSGERALNIAGEQIRSGAKIVVVNSVPNLTPTSSFAATATAGFAGAVGDANMGTQARLMSQALRNLAAMASKTGTTLVFINHARQNTGEAFEDTGSNAMKYYASVRLDVRRTGSRTRARVLKNKFAPPFQEAELEFPRGNTPTPTFAPVVPAPDVSAPAPEARTLASRFSDEYAELLVRAAKEGKASPGFAEPDAAKKFADRVVSGMRKGEFPVGENWKKAAKKMGLPTTQKALADALFADSPAATVPAPSPAPSLAPATKPIEAAQKQRLENLLDSLAANGRTTWRDLARDAEVFSVWFEPSKLSRTRFNQMGNREQDEWNRKHANEGLKAEYFLLAKEKEGVYTPAPKTVFDYALEKYPSKNVEIKYVRSFLPDWAFQRATEKTKEKYADLLAKLEATAKASPKGPGAEKGAKGSKVREGLIRLAEKIVAESSLDDLSEETTFDLDEIREQASLLGVYELAEEQLAPEDVRFFHESLQRLASERLKAENPPPAPVPAPAATQAIAPALVQIEEQARKDEEEAAAAKKREEDKRAADDREAQLAQIAARQKSGESAVPLGFDVFDPVEVGLLPLWRVALEMLKRDVSFSVGKSEYRNPVIWRVESSLGPTHHYVVKEGTKGRKLYEARLEDDNGTIAVREVVPGTSDTKSEIVAKGSLTIESRDESRRLSEIRYSRGNMQDAGSDAALEDFEKADQANPFPEFDGPVPCMMDAESKRRVFERASKIPAYGLKSPEDITDDMMLAYCESYARQIREKKRQAREQAERPAKEKKESTGPRVSADEPRQTEAPAALYRYGARNRTVPDGFVEVEPPMQGQPGAKYGVVVYPRPLTIEEMRSYEMSEYVPAEEAIRRILAEVGYPKETAKLMRREPSFGRREMGFAFERAVEEKSFYTDVEVDSLLQAAADRLLQENPEPTVAPTTTAKTKPSNPAERERAWKVLKGEMAREMGVPTVVTNAKLTSAYEEAVEGIAPFSTTNTGAVVPETRPLPFEGVMGGYQELETVLRRGSAVVTKAKGGKFNVVYAPSSVILGQFPLLTNAQGFLESLPSGLVEGGAKASTAEMAERDRLLSRFRGAKVYS